MAGPVAEYVERVEQSRAEEAYAREQQAMLRSEGPTVIERGQWVSQDGIDEVRRDIGKSNDGYHAHLVVSPRGGDGPEYWSAPLPSVAAAREESYAMQERWERGKEVSVERQTVKAPAHQLSNREIVAEARELHSHFKHLSERYSQAPAEQRTQLRQEMAPLVDRERALRQEYTGRATQELSIDRSPAEISYAR